MVIAYSSDEKLWNFFTYVVCIVNTKSYEKLSLRSKTAISTTLHPFPPCPVRNVCMLNFNLKTYIYTYRIYYFFKGITRHFIISLAMAITRHHTRPEFYRVELLYEIRIACDCAPKHLSSASEDDV